MTVQVLEELCLRLVGLHANDDTITGATRLTLAVAELLLELAVIVAFELLLIVAVVALNVAEVAAAAAVTEAGTVSVELLFDKLMLAPPVGAAWVKVTVQVLEEFGPRLVGLHANDETRTGATKLRLAVAELPL